MTHTALCVCELYLKAMTWLHSHVLVGPTAASKALRSSKLQSAVLLVSKVVLTLLVLTQKVMDKLTNERSSQQIYVDLWRNQMQSLERHRRSKSSYSWSNESHNYFLPQSALKITPFYSLILCEPLEKVSGNKRRLGQQPAAGRWMGKILLQSRADGYSRTNINHSA